MDDSQKISQHLTTLPDWQASMLASVRELIHEADPKSTEAWKWDTPVYLHGGKLVCATGSFKDHVKINFFKGAQLPDQSHFNAGLESKQSRAIDVKQGETIKPEIILKLVRSAIAL